MKMKCFSKRKLNVRISKTKIKCAILGFSQNCCILGKSRKTRSNLAKIQQNSGKVSNILKKNQQKFQQFLTKKMRFQNGAKECIV